jgi:hypothetical protein
MLLHEHPETVVLWLQVALYSLFTLLLVGVAWRKRLDVWFLAFALSPAGLLFPVYDVAVVGRKDVLFFLAFAFYALWMPRSGRWTNSMAFVLGIAITLIHELFFFYTPYFFLMRRLQPDAEGTPRSYATELSLLAGSLVAMGLVSTVGADMHGEAQCAVLLGMGFKEQLCDGIMRYPVTTVRGGFDAVGVAIRRLSYLPAYSTGAVLAALPLVPFLASLRGDWRRQPLVVGGVAAVAFTLPMFAIALDWGRLINIHVMALAIVLAACILEDRTVPGSVFGARRWWIRIAIVLMVAMYLATWSIRHCCQVPLGAGLLAKLL